MKSASMRSRMKNSQKIKKQIISQLQRNEIENYKTRRKIRVAEVDAVSGLCFEIQIREEEIKSHIINSPTKTSGYAPIQVGSMGPLQHQ